MTAPALAGERATLGPVSASERVQLIDVLRGIALFGILLVNFTGPVGTATPAIDRALREALNVLVSGSFYPLFSFLFGLGFAVQLLRARQRGTGVVGIYVRRMLALFLISTFHNVIIWDGDVLVMYSILGLLLVPLHRLRDRWLLPLAILILALGLRGDRVSAFMHRIGAGPRSAELTELRQVARGSLGTIDNMLRQRVEAKPNVARAEAYAATLRAHWHDYTATVRQRFSRTFFLNAILPFFILGLIAGRRRLLQDAVRYRKPLAWSAGIAVAFAIAGNLYIYLTPPGDRILRELAFTAANHGATVFYIAAIAAAFVSYPLVASALRLFSAPGKIALTNYLLQSVVMTLLFAKYGLGLARPSTTMWFLLDVAFFFVVQATFSRWWVARYRFGPAEWVWRSMTYGVRQPMRLESRTSAEQWGVALPQTASEPVRTSV